MSDNKPINPVNLSAIQNRTITNFTREEITDMSFNELIEQKKIRFPENDNLKFILKIKVSNDDKIEKEYHLNYKNENKNQYKLVSIYEFVNKQKKKIIEFKKNNEPLGLVLFSVIINEYIVKEGDKSKYNIHYSRYSIEEEQEPEQQQQQQQQQQQEQQEQQEPEKQEQEPTQGGKVKAKGQKKKTSKKPVVSQSKENKYKEVLGKRMKIYKKPDSRKEFVRYKGELVALVEYKKSKKEMAKSKK